MFNILLILMLAFAFATVGVLFTGIVSMFRGGEFNRRYGNKLMRARVILQGITLVLLALLFFVR
ncbi:MAG TPA: twin transmembrane helix small protein [Alphaproteobacteria bacterium]|nr:twin transmembrane helix small protein [Alphaproteobacteria bacterium]